MDLDQKRRLIAAISSIFATMGRRNAGEIEGEAALAIYVEDLCDLPVEAVEQACKDFRRGVAGDSIWAPTQAQIRQEALKVAERMDRRRDDPALPPPNHGAFREIQREARKAAEERGLVNEFELQCEWRKFRTGFVALGATRKRWFDEWPKHCDQWHATIKPATQPIETEEDLKQCLR